MATCAVAHSISGMKGLGRVGGARLAPPARGGFSSKRDWSDAASTCAIRAHSGKYCSSSLSSSYHRGLSQSSSAAIVVPLKSDGPRRRERGLRGAIKNASGGDEFRSRRASFPSSAFPDGVQLVDSEQEAGVGRRNSGSAINSVSDDQNVAESHDDSLPSPLESEPPSENDIARPQPIVQGFADIPFVGEFALDLTAGAISGGGVAEFDSVAASVPLYQPKWIWFATSPEQENLFIDRAINATIVGSAGILALTKMLTVDHDYWHGWTLMEILRYAPVHNWFAYEELLKSHPIFAKMMISGTVYAIGDWIAQCYEGKPALEFNRLRMLRSGLVGFCLHGSMSHFYYQFCEWLFPFQGWWVVPLKVGFDQTIWSSFWNSVYFIVVGLLRFESPVQIWKELRSTFVRLLTAGWKLWPLAHLVTYGLVPVEQRLLWVDMVEIVWVTILANYSNEKAEARIAEAEIVEEIKVSSIEAAANAVYADEVAADEKLS